MFLACESIKILNEIITGNGLSINKLRYTMTDNVIQKYPVYLDFKIVNELLNNILLPLIMYDMERNEKPIIVAAIIVYQILLYHFFSDGNGRTAHLFLNYFMQLYEDPNNFYFCDFKKFFMTDDHEIFESINQFGSADLNRALDFFVESYNNCDKRILQQLR